MSHRVEFEEVVTGKLTGSKVRVQGLVEVGKGARFASVGEEAPFPPEDSVTLAEDCSLLKGIPRIFVQNLSISDILAFPRHT
jgi:hypothetical protein